LHPAIYKQPLTLSQSNKELQADSGSRNGKVNGQTRRSSWRSFPGSWTPFDAAIPSDSPTPPSLLSDTVSCPDCTLDLAHCCSWRNQGEPR